MAAISLDRPPKHTVLRSFAGHLDAGPDAVYAALAAHFEGLGHLEEQRGDAGSAIADPATRTVIVQGSWWYRGEYRVRAEDQGSVVEHEIVNVAPTWHWAGPIAGRDVIRSAPSGFQALLTEISDALV